jgi:hypothetical protein
MVLGLYEAFNKALAENDGAAVPGFEFAGEVVQVGPSVSQHAVGDRVFGFCRFGAYRTSVVVRETLMRRAPDDWSYAEAASVLVQGLTAWHGLVELGRATKGSQVLVHSAAGGVGCAALEICDAIGASAVGVRLHSLQRCSFLPAASLALACRLLSAPSFPPPLCKTQRLRVPLAAGRRLRGEGAVSQGALPEVHAPRAHHREGLRQAARCARDGV